MATMSILKAEADPKETLTALPWSPSMRVDKPLKDGLK